MKLISKDAIVWNFIHHIVWDILVVILALHYRPMFLWLLLIDGPLDFIKSPKKKEKINKTHKEV